MKKFRWVAWMPSPYFVDRFNEFAVKDDLDFDVFFLASGSSVQSWSISPTQFKFKYRFLMKRADNSGYRLLPRMYLPRPFRIIRGRPDAIVLLYSDISCLLAIPLCRLLDIKVYLFVANTINDRRISSPISEVLKRLVFKSAHGIFATGPRQSEYARRYIGAISGSRSNKIFEVGNPSVVPEGLVSEALKRRDDLRMQFGWSEKFVILYVGRLSPEKNLVTLMKAVAQLKQECNGLEPVLAMVGDGPLRDQVQAEAKELAINVELMGFLQQAQLAEIYASADVFVLPSSSEPWGLVVNEAMQFSLPVITSDLVGCSPVLVEEGKNGYTFPFQDFVSLTKRLLILKEDQNLRKQMGQRSREIVSTQTIEKFVDSVIAALN